jgi:signal transduction histidine kinase
LFSSSGGRRRREPHPRLDSIIAISRDGAVAKANLQARRALGEREAVEGEQLGAVLARLMVNPRLIQDGIVLSFPAGEGKVHELTLVLSDQEPLLSAAPPGPEKVRVNQDNPATHGVAVNVANFIAHELKNNIAIMLGLSQLLESTFDAMKSGDRMSALKGIESEGEHALVILDGLLKLVESRRQPEAGNAQVPLHSVLRKVVTAHKRRHPSRKFEVGGDSPVFATGNSTWIQLAIANLVSNAEKVTPGDEPIQVNLRQEGDNALVTIMDRGHALTPALYQGLWEIYSKGVPEGIEVSGSGIGLSLCKELVGAMGGKVWAGPRSRGGSGFSISLRSLPEPSPSVMKPP